MIIEETRVVNIDQIIDNVNSIVMESINLANHIVSIKVDDSINHVVDRSELFDILSNVPTKTIVDNVG